MTAKLSCAGEARDQIDLGLDLIRTAHNACYQQGGCNDADVMAIASTIEQAMKNFLVPVQDWLNEENVHEVESMVRGHQRRGAK